MEITLIIKDYLLLICILSLGTVFLLPFYVWIRFESGGAGLVVLIVGICWIVLLFAAPIAEVAILKDGQCERTAWVGSFRDGEKRFKLKKGCKYVYVSPDSGPYELDMYAVAYTQKKEKIGSPVPDMPPCEHKTVGKGELWEVPQKVIYMFREPDSKRETVLHGDEIVWCLDWIGTAQKVPAVYRELEYEIIPVDYY